MSGILDWIDVTDSNIPLLSRLHRKRIKIRESEEIKSISERKAVKALRGEGSRIPRAGADA